MATDFNKPTVEDQYAVVLSQLRANLDAVATGDFTGAVNIPENTRRFNEDTRRFEKRVGNLWQVLQGIFEISVRSAHTLIDTAFNEVWTVAQLRNASNINAGTLPVGRVGNLPAEKITSGTLTAGRIPGLDASKIIGGKLLAALLPNHSADLLTSGIVNFLRLPVATNTQRGAVVVDNALTADGQNPVTGSAVHDGNERDTFARWELCECVVLTADHGEYSNAGGALKAIVEIAGGWVVGWRRTVKSSILSLAEKGDSRI